MCYFIDLKKTQKWSNLSEQSTIKIADVTLPAKLFFLTTETYKKMPLNPYSDWVFIPITDVHPMLHGCNILRRIFMPLPVRTRQDAEIQKSV